MVNYKPRQPVGRGRGNVDDRPMPPWWIVLHTSEQLSEHIGSAEDLNQFISTPATDNNLASYHGDTDTDGIYPLCWDHKRAHAASGGNVNGLHICIPGKAAQSEAEWFDAITGQFLEQAAQYAADKCKLYGIPPRLVNEADVKAGLKGICDHWTITRAFKISTHTDNGPNFPWFWFIARVNQIMGEERFDPANRFYGAWPGFANKPDLYLKDPWFEGDAVEYLQGVLLNEANQKVVVDRKYGPQTQEAVFNLRAFIGLKRRGGCGPRVWPTVDVLGKRGNKST